MSTAYYLLPGARLPKDVAPAVIPRIDRSLLDPILEGLGTPVCQRLAEGLTLPFARCTHHLWFWGVVPRGKTTPAHAAYVWLEDHGPTLATEIWSVTPCVEENSEAILSPRKKSTAARNRSGRRSRNSVSSSSSGIRSGTPPA